MAVPAWLNVALVYPRMAPRVEGTRHMGRTGTDGMPVVCDMLLVCAS